jgi:hypothetical protein
VTLLILQLPPDSRYSFLGSYIFLSVLFSNRAAIAQSVWRWATSWTTGILGFDSRLCLGIFLFTTASRTALGPTQPPIQWVPGALSLGVKRPGRGSDHSPPSSAEVKECVELYLHSPNTPPWRGAHLRKAQGQRLPLLYLPVSYLSRYVNIKILAIVLYECENSSLDLRENLD